MKLRSNRIKLRFPFTCTGVPIYSQMCHAYYNMSNQSSSFITFAIFFRKRNLLQSDIWHKADTRGGWDTAARYFYSSRSPKCNIYCVDYYVDFERNSKSLLLKNDFDQSSVLQVTISYMVKIKDIRHSFILTKLKKKKHEIL